MNYPDVLRQLRELIAAPLVDQTPSFLGEAKDEVKDAVDAVLPNLLGAIVHKGLSTQSGARTLMAVLESPQLDEAVPRASLDHIFSGGPLTESLIGRGSALLARLFGDRADSIVRAAAGIGHLRPASSNLLLAMMFPFALAVLRNAWMASPDGADHDSLVRLLLAQRHAIHPSLLERFVVALGIPSGAAWLDSTAGPSVVKPLTDNNGSQSSRESKVRRRLPWVLILLMLLALVAAVILAYCTGKTGDVSGSEGPASQPVAASSPSSSAASAVPASSVPASAPSTAASESISGSSSAAAAVALPESGAPPALTVRFGYASSTLPADFPQTASALVTYAKDHPATAFEVSGFADSTGRRSFNERLADRRADAVITALREAGVSAAQLLRGSSQIVSGTSDAAVARRAEVRSKP